jgi:hypothetical protein
MSLAGALTVGNGAAVLLAAPVLKAGEVLSSRW